MAYIFRDTVNIYDKEAIARAIKTQETQFNVLQGKIQALITDTELDILRNGGSTMYSRMVNVEATANGVTSEVSALKTDIRDNYSTTESMRSEIQQSAQEITASVSTAISGLNTRVQQAETKVTPSAIISTVASTDGARAMVSAINQTASTVQISAAHINLVGAVTANDIAAGAITTEKLAAGAVTANKIDVDDLFAQDITATGTITGATISGGYISGGTVYGASVQGGTISGSRIESNTGKIGGWNLSSSGFTSDDGSISLLSTTQSLHDDRVTIGSLSINGYGVMTTGDVNCNGDLRFSSYGDLPVVGGVSAKGIMLGHDATLENHEDRIYDLEHASPSYPANITCTTLTTTGQLAGDSLSVTHGITAVQIDLTGHVNAGNITGTDLYTQTSNAGTGSNAVITGTGRVAPTTASSKRYKDHISSVTLEQAMKVLDIPVINFKYKEGYLAKGDEMEGKQMPGFYAEDVYGLIPEAIYHDREGRVENWKERIILPLMLKVIQEQQHEIDELKRR